RDPATKHVELAITQSAGLRIVVRAVDRSVTSIDPRVPTMIKDLGTVRGNVCVGHGRNHDIRGCAHQRRDAVLSNPTPGLRIRHKVYGGVWSVSFTHS